MDKNRQTWTAEEKTVHQNLTSILDFIGDDSARDGLYDTPFRMMQSWKEIFGGYREDPKQILSTAFKNEGDYQDMVVLKDIEFYSVCEHHFLPFIGKAHIAYIPEIGGRVVGISKLARVVEAFAHRLQIQEKMTKDIAEAIKENLGVASVAVVVEAEHLCMKMRGVKNHSSVMLTSSLSGHFEEVETRAEFLQLVRS